MRYRAIVRRNQRRALLAATLAATLGLAASASAQGSALPSLKLTLAHGSIAVAGAEQSGAVEITTTTASSAKEASAVLILLKPGVTPAEAEAFLATNKAVRDPNTVVRFGSIVFDVEAAAGTGSAQTVLVPGTYLAINSEGEKSSAWPRTSFTVAASAAPAALPKPQAVVRTIDYAFRGAATLQDGDLVGFENEGNVVHMTLGFPAKSKQAATKLASALRKGSNKQAEKLVAGPPVGFAGPLSSGGYQQEVVSAKPGWYVLACFMPTQDGREHTLLGMERVIKIVK
jgi:hypothetical protein